MNIENLDKETNIEVIEKKEKNINNNEEDKEKTKNISITLQKKTLKKLDKKIKEYNKNNYLKLNRSNLINMLIEKYIDNLL